MTRPDGWPEGSIDAWVMDLFAAEDTGRYRIPRARARVGDREDPQIAAAEYQRDHCPEPADLSRELATWGAA